MTPDREPDRDLEVYESAYIVSLAGILIAVLAVVALAVGAPKLWRLVAGWLA